MKEAVRVEKSRRIDGSFRDPSGYVFTRGDQVYRAVDQPCHELLVRLEDEGLFGELIADRTLVPTEFVQNEQLLDTLRVENPGYERFLRHERVAPITYPYEWTISMLADAATHTLDLQIRLLESGCALKDATPYNIQFVDGRPTFIDISSIERPKRLDLWFALGQFSRMFLFPLLLVRYQGWDLRSYFRGNISGRSVEEVAESFGRLQKLRPRLLLDVTLPCWLQRFTESGRTRSWGEMENHDGNSNAQVVNLRRLRSKVVKLAAGHKPRGVWADYTKTHSYDDAAELAKKSAVREFLQETRPQRVLDLGCNTGDYSRIAAESGASVTAVDSDHDAVELLYRHLREKPAPITPAVIDLCNPSPGLGHRNKERSAFADRVGSDCVIALALIHHLLVSGNLSFEAIRELLAELTTRDLILEFVPTDDAMFERLTRFRVDLYGGVTLDECRSVFQQQFRVLREEAIPNTKRTLLFLRKE